MSKQVITSAPRAARVRTARKMALFLAPIATSFVAIGIIFRGGGPVDVFGLIPLSLGSLWSYCLLNFRSLRSSSEHDKDSDDGPEQGAAREQRRTFVNATLVLFGDILVAAGFFSFFFTQCALVPGFVGVWASIGIFALL